MLCGAGRSERLVQRDGLGRLVRDAARLGVGDFPVQEGHANARASGAVGLRDVRVDEEVAVLRRGRVLVLLGGERELGREERLCERKSVEDIPAVLRVWRTGGQELIAQIDGLVAILHVDFNLRIDAGDQRRDDAAGGE